MTHQYHNLRDSINVASTPAKRDYVMAEVTEIFKQYSLRALHNPHRCNLV